MAMEYLAAPRLLLEILRQHPSLLPPETLELELPEMTSGLPEMVSEVKRPDRNWGWPRIFPMNLLRLL